jgi:hypothetical protein
MYEADVLIEDRPARPAEGTLEGGNGGPWYVRPTDDETWVAVTATSGGGGGWFLSTEGLDPESTQWEPVDASQVLGFVTNGHRLAVQLTAEMLVSCLVDGLSREASHLADVLIDDGFDISVSVIQHADVDLTLPPAWL